ncbi:MAG: hypothetical protein EP328_00015 [Gammaproteobacteria bacterium]|nr:MAG: hypothetical protein EP328_00015 [Gammaproteobacteria bacterium]
MSDLEQNSEINTEEAGMPSELESLKERADLMGISYHPNIGVDKLREKVAEALKSSEPPVPAEPAELSPAQLRHKKKKEATELVRIRITCMNPTKREWEGELFTAGNSLVGSHTKYVPFGVEWHVPRIIYNQIKQRQCQIFITKKDARGNSTRHGKLIKEFGIEELPNLSEKELKELAQRQAMAAGTAE